MQTYINKYWNENGRPRDYTCTNVCFAVAVENTARFEKPENWEKTEEQIPENMVFLYSVCGMKFYGHL